MPMRTRSAGRPWLAASRLSFSSSSRIVRGRAHGRGGVALEMIRGAEECHHAVAEELVDRAAMRVDRATQDRKMMVEELCRSGGVHLLRQRGEAGDVGEHDGEDRLARFGDADLSGAHQPGHQRARNIGRECAQADQHGIEGRGLVVQLLHPAARQRGHAVKVEIGNARGLAGDRLDRARQALAKQDRHDDRRHHRPQAQAGPIP